MLLICCNNNNNNSNNIIRTLTTTAPRPRSGPISGITPPSSVDPTAIPVRPDPLAGEEEGLVLPSPPPLLLPPFTQANHDSSYNIHFDDNKKMIINNN